MSESTKNFKFINPYNFIPMGKINQNIRMIVLKKTQWCNRVFCIDKNTIVYT